MVREEFLGTLKEELRARGFKLTAPRLAIIDYLADENGHPSVQDIYEGIRSEAPNIGMATIYRTVDLLLEIGVLRAFTLQDNRLRYEMNWPGNHHHHLICRRCGEVLEFGSCNFQLIAEEIEQVTRYRIHEHTLEVFGTCPQCERTV